MDFLLTLYYQMLISKDEREMQLVLDIFETGRNKNNASMKEEFKNHLAVNSLSFSESEIKQKEIYQKILDSLK